MKTYERYVDFPVEIIGQKGRLLLCTFSEAITLYESRIDNAICLESVQQEQEIFHCKSRIRQICRSYYHHFGDLGITLNAPIQSENASQLSNAISEEIAGIITHWIHQHDLQAKSKNSTKDVLTLTYIPAVSERLLSLATLSFQANGLPCFITIHESKFDSQAYQQTVHQHNKSTAYKTNNSDKEWLVGSYKCSNIWLTFSCICDDPTQVGTFIKNVVNSGTKHSPLDHKIDKDRHFYHIIALAREGRDTEALAGALLLIEERPYHKRAYYLIILLCERLRLYDELQFSLARATALWPDNALLCQHMYAAQIRSFESVTPQKMGGDNEIETLFQHHLTIMSRLAKNEVTIRKLQSHRHHCQSIITAMGQGNPFSLSSLDKVQYQCDLHAMKRSLDWSINVLRFRQLGRLSSMMLMLAMTILTIVDMTALVALIGTMIATIISEVQWKRKINQAISGRSAWQLWLVSGLDIRRILQQESKQEI